MRLGSTSSPSADSGYYTIPNATDVYISKTTGKDDLRTDGTHTGTADTFLVSTRRRRYRYRFNKVHKGVGAGISETANRTNNNEKSLGELATNE